MTTTPPPPVSPFPNGKNPLESLPLIKELNPLQLEALKFGLGSLFLGTTSGLIFGGVTTLMRGIQEIPAGRANLLRSFNLFSVAGIAYGVTGSSLMLIDGEDSYTNRMISGCSAGAALGIYNRSLSVACVGCVSLGALAAFSKKFDANGLNEKSEFLRELSRPLPKSEEKWN